MEKKKLLLLGATGMAIRKHLLEKCNDPGVSLSN
jgi:hypothetical protein